MVYHIQSCRNQKTTGLWMHGLFDAQENQMNCETGWSEGKVSFRIECKSFVRIPKDYNPTNQPTFVEKFLKSTQLL